jgi:hypothetical protein
LEPFEGSLHALNPSFAPFVSASALVKLARRVKGWQHGVPQFGFPELGQQ